MELRNLQLKQEVETLVGCVARRSKATLSLEHTFPHNDKRSQILFAFTGASTCTCTNPVMKSAKTITYFTSNRSSDAETRTVHNTHTHTCIRMLQELDQELRVVQID
eukprot:1891831-Amphidinium_carterae.1